jgi:hypothetical protein
VDVQGLGRILVLLGISLAIVGVIMLLLGRSGVTSLPGDIRIQSQGWGCYVPILGSIILSIVLTIVLNLLLRFFR